MPDEEISNQDTRKILENIDSNGIKLGELSSFAFCQFCLSKLTNIGAYNYEVINLTNKLNEWNYEMKISEDSRIDILIRLQQLGLYEPINN